jgi:predicted enzyme related to lactoylglutathione lyase
VLRGLTTVTYTADDLAAATKWYSELLGTEPYFRRREYVEFRLGDYQHELGILDRRYRPAAASAGPRPAPAGAVVYWHVDDVAATLERLVSLGAEELEAPRDFGEGFVGASVVDPFGNILGVMHNPHYLEVLGRIPAFDLPEIKPVVIPDAR